MDVVKCPAFSAEEVDTDGAEVFVARVDISKHFPEGCSPTNSLLEVLPVLSAETF